MKMHGKILLFKSESGTGILINASREKISFNIENWDDFDVMPILGLEVVFNQEDKEAFSIVAKVNEESLRDDDTSLNEKPQIENESEQVDEEEKSIEAENPTEEENSKETSKEIPSEEKQDSLPIKEEETPQETPPIEDKAISTEQDESEKTVEEPVLEEEHFNDDPVIDIIEEMKEELEKPRPTSITNSLNINTAVTNYFNIIKQNIDRRKNYKKASGRLDYRLIRRFIWTTYNNLTEIDIEIITPKVKILCEDLKNMEKVYDDFVRKTKHPSVAYEEVFLSCQSEYQKIRDGAETLVEKLGQLKANEKIIGGAKEVKKKEIETEIQSEHFSALKDELKSLNGAYVDVVHMMAELDEHYKKDMLLLKEFEAEYREDFYKIFSQKAKEYEFDLVDILNAQAFIFDMQQWHQAKRSKSVKTYFKSSSVTGELNTKTYLKYYLSTQDEGKATDETKKLFELYEYLVSVQKDYILVITADYRDAVDYETAIHDADKSYDVKSFVDEVLAIKWAMKNSVKILVIEERLATVPAEKFLYNYSKNVLSTPKIVFLGTKPRSNTIPISKLLNNGSSPKLVAVSVSSLMDGESKS